jgi:integrase
VHVRVGDELGAEVPLFPVVERELVALLERRLGDLRAQRGSDVDPRELDDELVLRSRTGTALNHRNVATRGVEKAAAAAGLGKVTPKVLRASFCSLAGRRGVDPIEASQLTGHSLAVWARHYARSFGKAQRDEARARMLGHGFGADENESHLISRDGERG